MIKVKRFIKNLLYRLGYRVIGVDPIPFGYSTLEAAEINLCKRYSMTSRLQLAFLVDAMSYIESNSIPGDVVECGVWKGGSALMMAIKLEQSKSQKTLWLYDTFDGMTSPGTYDRKIGGTMTAQQMLDSSSKSNAENVWAYASLQEVKNNIFNNTSFPQSRVKFIVGDVAQTLLVDKPTKIALLRLDTDWYESTLTELQNLFELVSFGGVVVIDDYGHWEGSKRATDDFLQASGLKPLMFTIGPSRVFLKNNLPH